MSSVIARRFPIRGPVASTALRLLMASLLMAFSLGVCAEPTAATQVLAVAKQNFAQVKQQHMIAKLQLQAGQASSAQVSFTLARAQAAQMNSNLIRLSNENQDTLQRGLYRNRVSQEQAVQTNGVVNNTAQSLQSRLLVLSVQPNSQLDLILADQALTQLTADLQRLEQFMIAAQL